MGFGYWFRVGLMILSFAAIVFIIKNLNEYGLGTEGRNLLGISSPAPGTAENQKLDLCQTRVHSLMVPGHEKIFEKDLKWYRESKSSAQQTLDVIAMEKWLSRNCLLNVAKVKPDPALASQFTPALIVDFIEGGSEVLQKAGDGLFRWKGTWFHSQQLQQALEHLNHIPDAPPPGPPVTPTDR